MPAASVVVLCILFNFLYVHAKGPCCGHACVRASLAWLHYCGQLKPCVVLLVAICSRALKTQLLYSLCKCGAVVSCTH